jgi:hypothetical protein
MRALGSPVARPPAAPPGQPLVLLSLPPIARARFVDGPDESGDYGFFFTTSCPPPELLGQLAERSWTVLRTFTTADLTDAGQIRLEKIH